MIDFAKDTAVKIRASFLFLMQSCTEIKEYNNPHFKEIREDVFRAAYDLEYSENLQSHYKKLISALKDLFALKMYFHKAEEWRGLSILHKDALTSDVEPTRVGLLFSEHVRGLMKDKEDNEIDMEDLGDWMGMIPLRMTTARYYDYISDAIKGLDTNLNTHCIDNFKAVFNPMDLLGDDEWLIDIKKRLEKIWEAEEHSGDDKEEVQKILREQIELAAYIGLLFDAVCAANIIQSAERNGVDLPGDAGDFHTEYKIIINKSEPDENFDMRLDKAVSDAMLEAENYAFEDRPSPEDLDAETLALYNEWFRIDDIYFKNMFDYYRFLPDADENDEDDFPALMSELRKYMDESVKNLSGRRKRFLRQQFMRYFPYPYDFEKYEQYFMDTYESLDVATRRVFSLIVYIVNDDPAGDIDLS